MSDAAKRYVDTCTAKGGALALLKAIADLIPEGETTTPPLTIEDLANYARCVDRTARSNRDVLERDGEIKVHDGGRGKVARYEMLRLVEGARPLTAAPLPLLGRAKPVRTKTSVKETSATSADLFESVNETSATSADVGEVRAYDIGNYCRRWWANVGNFCRRWWMRTIKERSTSATSADLFESVKETSATSADVGAHNDADLISARAIVVERSTEVEEAARARDGDAFLTWWRATFPTHNGGAAAFVDRARDGPIVRALLDQYPFDLLQAMAVLLWTTTTDGIRGSHRWWIAERCPDRGLFALRHKATYLAREVSLRTQEAAAAGDVWGQVLDRLAEKLDRHTFHTWFAHSSLLDDAGDVIEVAVPSALHGEWIQKHHHDVVAEALREVRAGARVAFVGERKAGSG